MNKWCIFLLCILFTLLMPLAACASSTITVTGGWNEMINASDLTAGAGSDITGTLTSSSNVTYITITAASPEENWRLEVRRIDSNWNSQCTLWVRRTSDGSGSGSITGGTAYQEVTTTNQQFFSGTGSRSDITCEYKLEGMSIQIDPASYSTSVIFSIVNY